MHQKLTTMGWQEPWDSKRMVVNSLVPILTLKIRPRKVQRPFWPVLYYFEFVQVESEIYSIFHSSNQILKIRPRNTFKRPLWSVHTIFWKCTGWVRILLNFSFIKSFKIDQKSSKFSKIPRARWVIVSHKTFYPKAYDLKRYYITIFEKLSESLQSKLGCLPAVSPVFFAGLNGIPDFSALWKVFRVRHHSI